MADALDYTRRPEAAEELLVAAEAFLGLVGDDLLDRMRHNVPKETWSLHDSLEKRPGRDGAVAFVEVGVNDEYTSPVGRHPADYVLFVEKGTSRQAAEPFELPSLLQTIGNLDNVRGMKK